MTERPFTSHSLAEWLDHILALHPTEIDLGLTRVRAVAQRLHLDTLPHSTVITVAGTNGKGTTCALLEQVLMAAGRSVGVFSSPHIERYTERVRINGAERPESEHVDAFQAIAAAQGDTSLTFFEYSTLGALHLFARHKPDVVLLEVGLGGRLDATNLIDADLAVVTSIDLDHQEYLGDTRESVGREKSGIFRRGHPAICGEPNPPVTVEEEANRIGAVLQQRGHHFDGRFTTTEWGFRGALWQLEGLPLPHIPQDNAVTALAALEALWPELSVQAIEAGLRQTRVEGRLEPLCDQPRLVVDVAHNPHAARHLAQWLAQQPEPRVHGVCAMLKDKDIEATLVAIKASIDHWYLAPLSGPRGAEAERLAQSLPQGLCYDSVADALEAAIVNAAPEDLVIVFGSFYTVAQAKSYWQTRR
ncbi:bifunctional tetrahydrofolate synthase/dihydrofolate synthase [Ferrimonas balearica]|uniref:bifunctional tetrahydrofolate synthase/dihydrofolate synthase n=1 Tax=Ferrimonas balearica TaxID=44012 RepID=UPI001C9940EF|nr:bifunctional tetrahydrofolate synthase/dihydrofolate synthase [Ferrimonas balearica]MBY5922131.1 bifunctional tetrahydrofolate synthase/dihydrofolate synthase [Ferrimonas balearica]MBY5994529.1 bifunctional tetrahydrofolate synthase/dihydrofolate synthase [Ferrimonas balearica]